MNRLTAFLLLVLAVATIRAGLIVNSTANCADVKIRLPYNFTELRVDETNYRFNGTHCINKENEGDVIECSVQEDGEGNFLAKAHICGVQNKYFAGFKVEELLHENRHAYISVHFSQGGKWSNIGQSCIQPQLIDKTQIAAGGLESVDIKCVRLHDCYANFTTIMTGDKTLCSDYIRPRCAFKNLEGNLTELTVKVEAPKSVGKGKGRGRTFAFCTNTKDYLSYEIDWDLTCSFISHSCLSFHAFLFAPHPQPHPFPFLFQPRRLKQHY